MLSKQTDIKYIYGEKTIEGIIKYQGIEFTYYYENGKLRLLVNLNAIPKKESLFLKKRTDVDGELFHDNHFVIKEKYLFGKTNRFNQYVAFFIKDGKADYSSYLSITLVVTDYILFTGKIEDIKQFEFYSKEIEWIYKSSTYRNNDKPKLISALENENNIIERTEPEEFEYKNENIKCWFEVKMHSQINANPPSLEFKPMFILLLENIIDINDAHDIFHSVLKLIQFLCYRRDITMHNAELLNGSGEIIGEYCRVVQGEIDSGSFMNFNCIKYKNIEGKIGKIMGDIISNELYIRHVPDSYSDRIEMDEARFVMVTAAFEHLFSAISYQSKIKPRSQTARDNVLKSLETMDKSNFNQPENKIIAKLVDIINEIPLELDIRTAYKENYDCFGKLIEYQYKDNNKEFDIKKVSKRIMDQRNKYAHGNIDSNIYDEAEYDLEFLEFLIYSMQFKIYGLDNDNIDDIIRSLLCRHDHIKS